GEARLDDAGLHDAGLLDAELDRAALGALDGGGDIHGHSADLRVWHHAAGPKHLTEAADQRHHVGRGDTAIEIDVAALHLLHQVLRADHVGAGGPGFVRFRTAREHADAQRAAGAVRQVDDATDHLVGVARINAEIDRNLDGLVELCLGARLDHLDGLRDRVGLLDIDAFAGGLETLSDYHGPLPRNFQTHRTGGALDHLHGRLDGVAIEILHLLLGDLAHLRLGHLAGLVAARSFRPGLDLGGLLEEVGHRRRLHLEGEGTVRIDGDDHRDRSILLFLLGLGVERLAELHDVETALTKRGTDRGRRVRRTGRHLKLQESGHFLCHVSLLLCRRAGGFRFRGADLDGWRPPSPPTTSLVYTKIAPRAFTKTHFVLSSDLLDLIEFQFDRGRAAEDRHG